MNTRLIDISPPVTPDLAVWPGDVPFSRDVALDMGRGDHMTLSSITSTVHLGAHADAPSHYRADGAGIDERPLEVYFGPCQVMAVDVGRYTRIRPEDLPEPVEAPRLLLKTGTYPDPNRFDADFASLSAELVEHLHARGVRLVGIDTPSVDLEDDAELQSHHVLARHDMANLEGLVLSHVAPGRYTLVALPLRLVGCDASPVRAALIPED